MTGEPCGVATLAVVGDPDIGSKLAADFVPQTQAGIEIGQTGTETPSGISLAIEVHLDLRLRDQAIGQQQVVGAMQPRGDMPSIARIHGRPQIEKSGGQSLDPYGTP